MAVNDMPFTRHYVTRKTRRAELAFLVVVAGMATAAALILPGPLGHKTHRRTGAQALGASVQRQTFLSPVTAPQLRSGEAAPAAFRELAAPTAQERSTGGAQTFKVTNAEAIEPSIAQA